LNPNLINHLISNIRHEEFKVKSKKDVEQELRISSKNTITINNDYMRDVVIIIIIHMTHFNRSHRIFIENILYSFISIKCILNFLIFFYLIIYILQIIFILFSLQIAKKSRSHFHFQVDIFCLQYKQISSIINSYSVCYSLHISYNIPVKLSSCSAVKNEYILIY